jgi:type II secretory pathway pseudopilin PulG
MRKSTKGFALVEVVIVVVLLSGALLVFLEALSQAKSVQVKSLIVTTQSVLLHSKINELRSLNFDDINQSGSYIPFSEHPSFSYLYNVSFVNNNLQTVSNATNMKRIDLNIKHNSNTYSVITESFIISKL